MTTIGLGTYIEKTPGVLGGRPRIAGRRIAVDHIVFALTRSGSTVEDLCIAYDLSPAQIHAAMVYYYEHRDEIDPIVEEDAAYEPTPESRAARDELLGKWKARTGYDPDEMMTVTQVAQEYGISAQAVRKAAKEGWIGASKSGSTWLIKRLFAHTRWGEKD